MAGIGCHYMVRWLDRETETFSQMGGEGAQWIGQAPFSEDSHIFANLGDGTYFHSGILAIRAAVAAGDYGSCAAAGLGSVCPCRRRIPGVLVLAGRPDSPQLRGAGRPEAAPAPPAATGSMDDEVLTVLQLQE